LNTETENCGFQIFTHFSCVLWDLHAYIKNTAANLFLVKTVLKLKALLKTMNCALRKNEASMPNECNLSKICHLGYVLSKEAVHQLVTNGYTKEEECNGENSTTVQFGILSLQLITKKKPML
jgi:uncharacterized secreted protein with C-terminal beta-propeller domain